MCLLPDLLHLNTTCYAVAESQRWVDKIDFCLYDTELGTKANSGGYVIFKGAAASLTGEKEQREAL